jgi:arsenate reductase (glutaredoxin)
MEITPMMMMAKCAQLYWMASCSTCQKAKALLEAHGVTLTLLHDMKASPLPKDTIEQLAKAVGGVEALFSKRAIKYRQLGLNEKTLTDAEMLGYMAEEYTFIKRPVILFDSGESFAGFAPKQLEAFLKA